MFFTLYRCSNYLSDKWWLVWSIALPTGGAIIWLTWLTDRGFGFWTGYLTTILVAFYVFTELKPWFASHARGEMIVFYEDRLKEWTDHLENFRPASAERRPVSLRKLKRDLKEADGDLLAVRFKLVELQRAIGNTRCLPPEHLQRLYLQADALAKMARDREAAPVRLASSLSGGMQN